MARNHPESRHVRQEAQKQVQDLNGLDYSAPAELFVTRAKRHKGNVTYKRFDTAAEALRFAIEEIPAPELNGVYLEVNGARF